MNMVGPDNEELHFRAFWTGFGSLFSVSVESLKNSERFSTATSILGISLSGVCGLIKNVIVRSWTTIFCFQGSLL